MSFVELVHAVAERAGVPRREARAILKAFMAETSKTLKSGERVVLPGFGVFDVHETKPRPLFGGERQLTKTRRIKFRPSRRSW